MAESRQMSKGQGDRGDNRSPVCGRFYDNGSGPSWPALNTKIILNKSSTVGARLVLRQRVCVTAPLFTKMRNCITRDRKNYLERL